MFGRSAATADEELSKECVIAAAYEEAATAKLAPVAPITVAKSRRSLRPPGRRLSGQ
jgi:hypothetical protein